LTHGDSPHPKIGQMNHLLGVCIALDDYRSNLLYLAQPQASACEMVRSGWLNSTFLCLLPLPLPHFLSGNRDQWVCVAWSCAPKIYLTLSLAAGEGFPQNWALPLQPVCHVSKSQNLLHCFKPKSERQSLVLVKKEGFVQLLTKRYVS